MKKLNLTDKRKPDYFYSEAIKTLRTNIQLSGQSIKDKFWLQAAFRMKVRVM